MQSVVRFMNSTTGRLARIALGAALIAIGLVSIGGTAGLVVAAVGLVPVGLGLSGRCVAELLVRRT